MDIIKRITAFFFSIFMAFTSIPSKTAKKKAESFRVTAYIAGEQIADMASLDKTHLKDVTDIILIGVASFDVNGELHFGNDFEKKTAVLQELLSGKPVNLYLNLSGPGSTVSSSDWYEQMDDQGKRHDMAFKSGKLENNIKAALEKYHFDGVFFDYEYPVYKEHWKVFDRFIISLNKVLGSDYKIGCAISAWLTLQSRRAIRCLDMVEVMAYDVWDDDGTHASMDSMKGIVKELKKNGYGIFLLSNASLDFYENKKALRTVDGTVDMMDVFKAITDILG